MNRRAFGHLLAAAVKVADQDGLVVIGSQALLGPTPTPAGDIFAARSGASQPPLGRITDGWIRNAVDKPSEVGGRSRARLWNTP